MKIYHDIYAQGQSRKILNKSALLLALGIFLVIAPSPDVATLADLTQNFIVSLP
jgi:hypothetical protein